MNSTTKKVKVARIIDVLEKIDIDGETMEYIIGKVGMTDQMLRQLVLNSKSDILNSLVEEKNSLEETMKYAEYVISEGDMYGLTPEIVIWALKYMKEDPNLTIKQALIYSFNEWIK